MDNTSTVDFQQWFIPSDAVVIVCFLLTIICGSIFLCLILADKTYRTLSMILVANSYLTQICFAILLLTMYVLTLRNDLQQRRSLDSLCTFRGYLSYSLCGAMTYSFLLHAVYRYVSVVYPNRLFFLSPRGQLVLISLTWLYVFLYPIAFLFTGDITYNYPNQVCQMPFRLSFAVLFTMLNTYVVPMLGIQIIYVKLVRFVREMSQRVTAANSLVRARNQLKMLHQVLLIVTILTVLGMPYTSFLIMSWFTEPPRYHFRISSVFIAVALVLISIVLMLFNDPLKASVRRRVNRRTAIVTPVAFSLRY